MALVVDSYRPSYVDVARYAREGAAGQAYRENLDRTIGRTQDQSQFDTGLAQRERAMQQQAIERANDRAFDAERIQFMAGQQAAEEAAQNAEWERRARINADLQQEQEEFQYSSRQKAELARIDSSMAEVEKLAARGDLDESQSRYARYQLQSQRLGIKPMEPKPRAMEEFPSMTLADGRKVWQVPGRAGDVSFRDQATGRSMDDIYEAEDRRQELLLQNQAKENTTAAQAAVKLSDAQAKAALEQQKTAAEIEAAKIKLAVDLESKKIDAYLKLMGDKNELGGSKFTPEQAKQHVEDAFKHFGGGSMPAGGAMPTATQQPPVRVHSSQIQQAARNAPRGTRFVDENGDVYEME